LGETTGHYETNPIKTHETSSVCVCHCCMRSEQVYVSKALCLDPCQYQRSGMFQIVKECWFHHQ